ncbi:hypothetical protein C2G38_2201648 [Gigaspora rosea]|uniref:Uncharacterized protein n=1 Tax=Gigaspora rosea TaxID=44941 RepID=A0A397UQI3_9GLOM|nr:hypothetical protein C2G38_2201648 [Gigaspora rosea]
MTSDTFKNKKAKIITNCEVSENNDNRLEPKRDMLTSLAILRSKKEQVLADALCKIEE